MNNLLPQSKLPQSRIVKQQTVCRLGDRNAGLAASESNRGERGAAMVVALIVIVAFILIATQANQIVSALSKENNKFELTKTEAARAEFYYSMAEATLKYDVRAVYDAALRLGKQKELQLGGNGKLPMFDALTTNPEQSKPLLALDGAPTGVPAAQATSLYGSANRWADSAVNVSRRYIQAKLAEKQITEPEGAEILRFAEAYRRNIAETDEPVYAFKYTVRTRAGEFAEIVRDDVILLGPPIIAESVAGQNCASLNLTGAANPNNVAWGATTDLTLNYERAERLRIYDQSGSILFERNVTNEPTARTVNHTTAPLTVAATFVGEAVQGGCQVQVPIPVGVQFNQNISYTVNGQQSISIIEGDDVRYDWQVADALANYTTSWITFGTDATRLHENVYATSVVQPGPSAPTFSTLHAVDSRIGGAEQTATVNINVCRKPRFLATRITPSSVTQGGSAPITFEWQTEFAAEIRIVRAGDGAVLYQTSDASGSWTTGQPQTTTEYRFEALSICGAPAATQNQTVTVTSAPSCPAPAYQSFSVTPTSVTAGGNQQITFNFAFADASGTGARVRIENVDGTVIGGNLPLNGVYSTNQPQTTTSYVAKAVNCNGSNEVSSQPVTVTVSGGGGGGEQSCSFNMESEQICSVTNFNQCAPHRIEGSLTTNGNNYTFVQSHSPALGFGSDFLMNVGFTVFDANGRVITNGGWVYTDSGAANWSSRPSGAGQLLQGGVTINGVLPAGTVLPLRAEFGAGYGAAAGFDSKSFNTASSPGGCNNQNGGGGYCSTRQETTWYCDQNSNALSTYEGTVEIFPNGVNSYIVRVPTPVEDYNGARNSGYYEINSSSGTTRVNWTGNPGGGGQFLPVGTATTDITVNSTNGVSVTGFFQHYVATAGECTVNGSFTVQISFSGSAPCGNGFNMLPPHLREPNETRCAAPPRSSEFLFGKAFGFIR